MQAKALPGFRDFYPEELALRTHIFETWRRVASRYGFEEYDGPPLEPLELYTSKSGDEIVGQLYEFTDKGDRQVALRPEMTPTLARMVAARANGLKKPIRWFSIPQLFRYERQQRGRLKEHFQLNCDLIGEASPLADAEIIGLAIDLMRGFGLGRSDLRVRLSDRRILGPLLAAKTGVPDEWRDLQFAAIDRSEKYGRTEIATWILHEKKASLSQAQIDATLEIGAINRLEAVIQAAQGVPEAQAGVESLREVVRSLNAMGLGEYVDVDLTIVRGIAYYTGTVFELFDAGKTLRAICGGGRYDNLTEAVGGVSLPAVGFGMGDVVLGELLKDRGLVPPHRSSIDVFLAAIGEEDQSELLGLAHRLRDAGLRVEFALGAGAVGKQLKLADARNARLAVVIGPDDRARGEVQVKDLVEKTQEAVKSETLIANLQGRLSWKGGRGEGGK